ncbi:MAG: hypothetical protein WBE20_15305 [Candidatus Acidiferrales bacterium]
MFRLTSFAAAILFLVSYDLPHVYPLRPEPVSPLNLNLPTLASPPDIFLAIAESSGGKQKNPQMQSRFAIIRYVDGEYARVVQPLPADKHGFRYKVDKPVDVKELHYAVMRGTAANPGDHVQITNIQFRGKEIVISINGGTKSRFNWRQHVQVSAGPLPTSTTTYPGNSSQAIGAELILDFGGPVPNLTPDELKHDLAPFLQFSSEHSSAVNWVETLPPKIQQAIKDHVALTGMNHDMVTAALGRPDQKVRERDERGNETEDWIYGHPPAKVVFVTFSGDKVIRVKSYN